MEQFSLLLDSGLDNTTMIELSFKEHKKIIEELQKGHTLLSILSRQKGKTFQMIRLLSRSLSLKQTLQSIRILTQSTSELLKKLLKECIYPIFMLIFSYFMLFFFANVLLPAMKEYTDSNSFLIMYILESIYSIFFFMLISIFIFRKTFMYKIPIVKKYLTIRFAILLDSLLSISLPTSQALEILSGYESISMISMPIYTGLQEGKTFLSILKSNPYIDSNFIPLFQIGLETNTSKLLHIYIKKTTYSLSKEIKFISTAIQLISYLSVGCIVFLVYQIMLMPLNILNTM